MSRSDRPNIIMIMTDQQRWDALGAVNPLVRTPGIDSLVRNGIFYDQAVCQAPMCVPSRNSLMFGLYPSQTGVRTNRGALLDESRLPGVPLPQLMRDAGYFCAGFGKAHWNHALPGKPGSRRGFHVRAEGQSRSSILCEEGAAMMDDEDPEGLKAYYEETAEFGSGEENALGYIGKPSRLPEEHHRDGFIWRKCMEFLDGYEPSEQPLFLYFSLIKPHAGFNIPPQYEQLYRLEDIPDLPAPPWAEEPDTHMRAMMAVSPSLHDVHYNRKAVLETLPPEERRRITLRYWANCTFMDSFISRVLDKVREKGLDRNTLFVFLSDHGEMLGERDLRYSKYCLYESSVRVPLVLAGDAVPAALRGTRDSRPAMLADLMPTLCRAAGAAPDPRWPGKDLLSPLARPGAFCEFHGCGTERVQPAPAWMWRTPEWKLILFREGTVLEETPPRGELYDLRNDPHEWHNLFDDPALREIRDRLMMDLTAHMAAAFAKGPAFGDYRGLEPITPEA